LAVRAGSAAKRIQGASGGDREATELLKCAIRAMWKTPSRGSARTTDSY